MATLKDEEDLIHRLISQSVTETKPVKTNVKYHGYTLFNSENSTDKLVESSYEYDKIKLSDSTSIFTKEQQNAIASIFASKYIIWSALNKYPRCVFITESEMSKGIKKAKWNANDIDKIICVHSKGIDVFSNSMKGVDKFNFLKFSYLMSSSGPDTWDKIKNVLALKDSIQSETIKIEQNLTPDSVFLFGSKEVCFYVNEVKSSLLTSGPGVSRSKFESEIDPLITKVKKDKSGVSLINRILFIGADVFHKSSEASMPIVRMSKPTKNKLKEMSAILAGKSPSSSSFFDVSDEKTLTSNIENQNITSEIEEQIEKNTSSMKNELDYLLNESSDNESGEDIKEAISDYMSSDEGGVNSEAAEKF